MGGVSLHPDHLDALARDLRAYEQRVAAVLARARGLDAVVDVAPLSGAGEWARRTRTDLARRAELVRALERRRMPTLRRLGVDPLQVAGGTAAVPPLLAPSIDATGRLDAVTEPGRWQRLPDETLDDWVTRLLGQTAAQDTELDAVLVTGALRELLVYTSVTKALAGSGLASVSLVKSVLVPHLLTTQDSVPVLRGLSRVPFLGPFLAPYLQGAGGVDVARRVREMAVLKAPGTLPPWLTTVWGKATGLPPGQLSTTLEGLAVGEVNRRSTVLQRYLGTGRLNGSELARLTALRPDLPPDLLRDLASAPRGSTDLYRLWRADGLATARQVAGTFRAVGIAGQVAATGVSVVNLGIMDHRAVYRADKADYASRWAEAGFNVSLTAAMVAPTPFTLGAVAVTGVVYAGTEVWDDWDEISAWAGGGGPQRTLTAVSGFAGDRLDDVGQLADGAVDKAGEALDAVKESRLNPMGWG